MKTRKLGKTDLDLTTVGLGTWALGGPWQFGWGPQDDDDARKAIAEALEQGINWIDTAPAYGCGHSEELIGQVLEGEKSKPIMATKCGLLCDEKSRKVNCLDKDSIIRECHGSLERLGVDVIDLYQLHWPQPDKQLEEAWEAMAHCVEEGLVRYLGASNFRIEQLQRVQKIYPVSSLQPPYSMIHRDIEEELLGFCSEHSIGVVVYSPMQRGLLTGKFSHEHLAQLPDDDHRKKSPDFREPKFSATLELVEQLKPIAENNGASLAQLAISWVLRRDEVTAAIVGARRPGQIVETAKAMDVELSDSDIEKIEDLSGQWKDKTKR